MDTVQNNNQNNQQVQDQVQNPVQVPVSAPQGIKEGAPAVIENSDQVSAENIDSHIEHGPEFAPPPEITPDVANAGVVSHSSEPVIPKDIGVTKSIPQDISGPNYKISFTDKKEAADTAKNGPIDNARTWMALLWQKFLGQKENQPQT
jgi:hypothetical protein